MHAMFSFLGYVPVCLHSLSSGVIHLLLPSSFSSPFFQKQFTNQGWYKYQGISVGSSDIGYFGQPDTAGDFGQPAPCCQSSIKLAGAKRSWNGHSRQ
jgi:hypothetical protein